LGLVPPPTEKEAPVKADNEGDAKPKPIPAELGFLPKAPAADAGDKGDKGAADKGDGGAGVSKGSLSKDWPIDNFPSGIYAPDGVPYPL
jgi:hypothetical protein